MNKIKINELFNFQKGSLQSSKCTAGEFIFITASSEWKTHTNFTHDCEAIIFAAGAGGSLGRTHYVNNKFISSDLCFILTPKNQEVFPVDLFFYNLLFKSYREIIVQATKTGSSKESIGLGKFGNYELPYVEYHDQIKIKEKMIKFQHLQDNISNQLNLVNSLLDNYIYEQLEK